MERRTVYRMPFCNIAQIARFNKNYYGYVGARQIGASVCDCEVLMKTTISVVLLSLTLAVAASAQNIYVAQSAAGANSGADCSNAHPASWFNSSSQIVPGVTVHLCGTISTMLRVPADGASGQPVTILFEPNAKISLAYFTSTTGLIDISNRKWVVIDGGSNGIIELTGNGTSLAHQSDGYGVAVNGASNFTIKNLKIQNLYVRTGTTDSNGWGYGIFGGGSAVSGTNRITNNVIHDMSTCWIFNINGTMEIDHNDCGRVSWGFASGGGSPASFLFHDNKLHDGSVWYQVNDVFHNDAFHVWTTGGQWNNVQVYNNDFYGDWGTFTTGLVYLECDNTANSCPLQIYNNLFRASSSLTNGRVALKDAQNVRIYGNYFEGPGNAIHEENGGAGGSSGTQAVNNIFVNVDSPFALGPGPSTWSTRDYNAYWNTPAGPDTHKITSNPMLNSSYVPQLGSPLIDAGTALAATYAVDRTGTPRPQGSGWDIGPYEFTTGTASAPAPPTQLTAVAH